MGISAQLLAILAVAITVGTWVVYLSAVPRNVVARMPTYSIAAQVLGVAAATVAVVRDPSAPVLATSGGALVAGGLFLYVLTQRAIPEGNIAIHVGDTLLPFHTKNSDGSDFDSASLAGRRILLKFFRGSW